MLLLSSTGLYTDHRDCSVDASIALVHRGYGDRSANRRRENKGLNRIVYCDAICIVSNKISMPKKEVILMP